MATNTPCKTTIHCTLIMRISTLCTVKYVQPYTPHCLLSWNKLHMVSDPLKWELPFSLCVHVCVVFVPSDILCIIALGPYFDVFNLRDLAQKLDEAEKQCLVEGSPSSDHLERVTQVCTNNGITATSDCPSSSPLLLTADHCSNGHM